VVSREISQGRAMKSQLLVDGGRSMVEVGGEKGEFSEKSLDHEEMEGLILKDD